MSKPGCESEPYSVCTESFRSLHTRLDAIQQGQADQQKQLDGIAAELKRQRDGRRWWSEVGQRVLITLLTAGIMSVAGFLLFLYARHQV